MPPNDREPTIDREEIKARREAIWAQRQQWDATVRNLVDREQELGSRLLEALQSDRDWRGLAVEWSLMSRVLELARGRLDTISSEHLELGRLLDETNPRRALPKKPNQKVSDR